jgi:hypothetical protein
MLMIVTQLLWLAPARHPSTSTILEQLSSKMFRKPKASSEKYGYARD